MRHVRTALHAGGLREAHTGVRQGKPAGPPKKMQDFRFKQTALRTPDNLRPAVAIAVAIGMQDLPFTLPHHLTYLRPTRSSPASARCSTAPPSALQAPRQPRTSTPGPPPPPPRSALRPPPAPPGPPAGPVAAAAQPEAAAAAAARQAAAAAPCPSGSSRAARCGRPWPRCGRSMRRWRAGRTFGTCRTRRRGRTPRSSSAPPAAAATTHRRRSATSPSAAPYRPSPSSSRREVSGGLGACRWVVADTQFVFGARGLGPPGTAIHGETAALAFVRRSGQAWCSYRYLQPAASILPRMRSYLCRGTAR